MANVLTATAVSIIVVLRLTSLIDERPLFIVHLVLVNVVVNEEAYADNAEDGAQNRGSHEELVNRVH